MRRRKAINSVIKDAWLAKHSYLRPLAALEAVVDEAAQICAAKASLPCWEKYEDDFSAGIPLLENTSAAGLTNHARNDLAMDFAALVAWLALHPLPSNLNQRICNLYAELRADPNGARQAVDCLLGGDAGVTAEPGLLHYLGWAMMARYLRPVVEAFQRWRNEDRWLRSYCPTCGSLPAMAQLSGRDPARLRFLWCGRCRTSWRYPRIACPFCEKSDNHRLAVLAVEGESGLRIDYCESCKSYLKTYDGEGSESVMLADWTSIHLDAAAADRGLFRAAASLYEL
jgi:FdhE protein